MIDAACRTCALPTPRNVARCGACISRPPSFREAVATASYGYPYDWLIRRLKFGGELPIARILARLMWAARPNGWPDAEALVPIPLHRGRLLERGYDQALELARELGREGSIPVRADLLARVRGTSPQTGLSAAGRRRNVAGAFAVNARAELPASVCLIDDVMTTGATLDVAASTLLDAGVGKVVAWAAARAESAPQ